MSNVYLFKRCQWITKQAEKKKLESAEEGRSNLSLLNLDQALDP